MEDRDIVALYRARDERAIEETREKYGGYCFAIARNILTVPEDAEECVSDCYIEAWNSIPPHEPQVLPAFLARLVRCASLKRWRHMRAQKRGGRENTLVYEELSECIPDSGSVEQRAEAKELAALLDGFLASLPDSQRRVFVCRYWYFDTIEDICGRFGYGQSKVKSMLARTRRQLHTLLEKEGII